MIVRIGDNDEKKRTELCNYIYRLNGEHEVEIRKPYKSKSYRMYRYYGGVVLKTLCNELGYEKEEMHELLKSMFLKEVHELPDGSTTTKPRLVRSLTKDEMIDFVDRIKRWASQEFYIYIPDSEED